MKPLRRLAVALSVVALMTAAPYFVVELRAAFSVIASVSAGSTDSTTVTTAAMDSTGADGILLGVVDYTGGTTCTPSDSKSNTYTGLTAISEGGGGTRVRIYWDSAPTVGSGHTFTCTAAGTYPTVLAVAVSGMATSPTDQENGASGNPVTTQAPGSITPSEDNTIVIALCGHQIAGSLTLDGGFTETGDVDYGAGTNIGGMMARLIQTTATAANPTCTASGNSSMAAAIASFKTTAAASSPPSLGLLGVGK